MHHAQCYHTEQENKTDIAIPKECNPSKGARKIKGTRKEGTLIQCFREKAKRKGERKPLREARPPNLLNIALYGLTSSYLHPYPFCLHLGGRTLAPSVHAPRVYMQ